jgi:hypothetical protein
MFRIRGQRFARGAGVTGAARADESCCEAVPRILSPPDLPLTWAPSAPAAVGPSSSLERDPLSALTKFQWALPIHSFLAQRSRNIPHSLLVASQARLKCRETELTVP